jgi:hypothetical protein
VTDPTAAFIKMVPGFDFLTGLVKNAGAAMPNVGQWVAPTLDPEELEKRIGELRTVQFWLEQNARLLGTTIQALEVQRMTLATLKTMNVSLGDLTESLKVRVPEPAPSPSPKAAPAASAESAAAKPGVVDPMQWWGALTQQFQSIAQAAIKDASALKPTAASPRTGKKSATLKSASKAKAPAGRKSTTQAKAPARKAAPRSR